MALSGMQVEQYADRLVTMTAERDEAIIKYTGQANAAELERNRAIATLESVRQQLAASQERARELEGEIVKHRPKSECYDRVCQSLGISHDILGHVATLQATLAERERELHALATRHDAMLLRLGEVERDLYDAFHKHGQDNGMWGKWCARLLTQRNTARQDAARLMEVLDEFFHYGYDRNKCDKALKGQH